MTKTAKSPGCLEGMNQRKNWGIKSEVMREGEEELLIGDCLGKRENYST